MTTGNPGDRRTFFLTCIYGLWGLMASALAVPASVYILLPPKLRRNETEWAEAGDIGKLNINSPVEMVFRRNRTDGWRILSEKSTAWVVKTSETEVTAFAPQCTHLGCAYHWNERKNEFLCPCHTSSFSLEGKVLTGPAPRALDRYQVRLQENKLLLGEIHEATETTE